MTERKWEGKEKIEGKKYTCTWNKTMWFGVDAISDYDWVVAVQMRCLDDKQPLNKYIHVNYLQIMNSTYRHLL